MNAVTNAGELRIAYKPQQITATDMSVQELLAEAEQVTKKTRDQEKPLEKPAPVQRADGKAGEPKPELHPARLCVGNDGRSTGKVQGIYSPKTNPSSGSPAF